LEPVQTGDAAKLDAETYCAVQALRQKLCLTNEDLAAMGCSKECAENVLGTLVTWYQAKKAELASVPKAKTRRELRAAMTRFNVGPRDEKLIAQLPTLKKAYADALKQGLQIEGTAVTAVEMVLPDAQRRMWQDARKNLGVPSAYRFVPNLETRQVAALRGRPLAGDFVNGPNAAAPAAEDASAILSSMQQEAAATARANAARCMPGVLSASENVLPVPPELKPRLIGPGPLDNAKPGYPGSPSFKTDPIGKGQTQ
jgi:hypothetical protein